MAKRLAGSGAKAYQAALLHQMAHSRSSVSESRDDLLRRLSFLNHRLNDLVKETVSPLVKKKKKVGKVGLQLAQRESEHDGESGIWMRFGSQSEGRSWGGEEKGAL